MNIHKKIRQIAFAAALMPLLAASTATAHVVVSPNQVVAAERVTFAVSVPNEHDTPVITVRLVVPDSLSSVRPHAKAGWDVVLTHDGEGEDVRVSEITWRSAGGTVPVNMKDDFLFSAKAPAETGELQWKAYETYQNGLVVGWDQAPGETAGSHGDSKPYSVTRVLAESETAANLAKAETAASEAKKTANWAIYIGGAGVALALVAVALATRRA